MNSAAVNMGVPMPEILIAFPWAVHLEVGLLGHMAVLLLVFGGPSIVSSTVAAPVYIPANSAQGLEILS